MKKVIKLILILGLIYLFAIWVIAQSPYRCDKLNDIKYLTLMCD